MMSLPPDPIDRANDLAEQERAASIAAQLAKKELPHTGFCRWCSEPIKHGAFCDTDCRDDYEQNRQFKGR